MDKTDAGAMDAVGYFLMTLQEKVKGFLLPLPSRGVCASSSDGSLVLHIGPNYNQLQLTKMVVGIYNGLPQPFEVLRCHHDTSEEEINLFMERAIRHPRQYLVLQVNNLPFQLQEVRMQT